MAKCNNPDCNNPACNIDQELHNDIMAALIKHLDADPIHSQEMSLTLAFSVLIAASRVAGVNEEEVFQRGVIAAKLIPEPSTQASIVNLEDVLALAKQKGINLPEGFENTEAYKTIKAKVDASNAKIQQLDIPKINTITQHSESLFGKKVNNSN